MTFPFAKLFLPTLAACFALGFFGMHLVTVASAERSKPTKNVKPKNKFVVVFVDFSESTTDRYEAGERKIYRKALGQIVASLQPGDRILVAGITSETAVEFNPLIDETLPSVPEERWLVDNHLIYEQRKRVVEQKTCEAIARIALTLVSAPEWSESSKNTSVLTSLDLATKLFDSPSYQNVLVILSDMIEDSEDYNFERMPWDSKQIERIIATERSHRGDRLPNLTGVTVYVAGATIDSSGSEGKRMRLQRQIEDFWLAYFKACNADASDSRYA